ncbi:hypothetical protein BCR32DRAFT_294114 [Anaeromyces robustus]|uniref:Uncharacterized protein n=1 Tax=Anaeromyces robustus TaxID=1754192 RepID=A0A1Y1X2P4_9FUNG|nr:hypothetical protein BCR32DRAFT_294114 [Anaeromyces robustus]|eukprot:ORX79962.1 hypothetical protein BCR32DRAFT_294114 [Anaeromyces robustus]
MAESQSNRYIKCITNRASALLYLLLCFVLLLLVSIYGIIRWEEYRLFFVFIICAVEVLYLFSIYQLFKNGEISYYGTTYYPMKHFIILLIMIIGLGIVTVIISSDKAIIIPFIILLVIYITRQITYNEYVKEVEESSDHCQSNRDLEQGI